MKKWLTRYAVLFRVPEANISESIVFVLEHQTSNQTLVTTYDLVGNCELVGMNTVCLVLSTLIVA